MLCQNQPATKPDANRISIGGFSVANTSTLKPGSIDVLLLSLCIDQTYTSRVVVWVLEFSIILCAKPGHNCIYPVKSDMSTHNMTLSIASQKRYEYTYDISRIFIHNGLMHQSKSPRSYPILLSIINNGIYLSYSIRIIIPLGCGDRRVRFVRVDAHP